MVLAMVAVIGSQYEAPRCLTRRKPFNYYWFESQQRGLTCVPFTQKCWNRRTHVYCMYIFAFYTEPREACVKRMMLVL